MSSVTCAICGSKKGGTNDWWCCARRNPDELSGLAASKMRKTSILGSQPPWLARTRAPSAGADAHWPVAVSIIEKSFVRRTNRILQSTCPRSQALRILLSFASHTAPAIDHRTPKPETHANRVLLSEACAKV